MKLEARANRNAVTFNEVFGVWAPVVADTILDPEDVEMDVYY